MYISVVHTLSKSIIQKVFKIEVYAFVVAFECSDESRNLYEMV